MKVSLIGAGPGDPGLLTLRGRELLANADVIVYDALANSSLLDFARPEAELIYVGKIADQHAMPQSEINELLAAKAREKGHVARLKGGDPYIFGRGGEEAEYLADAGIPFEVVPGISSAIAAPAYAGIPLTQRDFVSSLTIITGHEKPGKPCSAHNWRAFVESGSTLVFVMAMKNLADICASLLESGMDPQMPAAIIYRGTTPMQRSLTSTLASLPDAATSHGFTNPSVIVVGRVVSLRDKLDWFSQKPLLGKRIVVTRAREQASELSQLLIERGALVLEFPSIEIRPMRDYRSCDTAIAHLSEYSWLIFTSVNGVKYFWQRLGMAGKDARSLASCKIAAIGPATAQALLQAGINPDLIPETYVAEAVATAILAQEGETLAGKRILIPRAAKARQALPDALGNAGAIVDITPVYEGAPPHGDSSEIRKLLAGGEIDCITFASSSTVENFLDVVPAEELAKSPDTLLAAIGPITAATLAKHGLKAEIQPRQFTVPALVEAIVARYSEDDG